MIAPLLLMLSCAKPVPPMATEPPSALALPALRGPVAALPGPQDTVRRIAFGSCANQNTPMPIMQSIRDRKPDVFVMLGDNVYGDADSGDPSLPELRDAYATLAQHKDFRPLTQEIPVLPIWDDHDYGDNDGGDKNINTGATDEIEVLEGEWRFLALSHTKSQFMAGRSEVERGAYCTPRRRPEASSV